MKPHLLFVFWILMSVPALAEDPFADPQIRQVQARLDKGIAGDSRAVKELVADLEKWTEEQPENHLLLAYLGSAYSLRSRDAWIADKLPYLNKAKETMDRAVSADPDNAAVRFVRATNLYHLPAIFGKRDAARADFKKLLTQLEGENPPEFDEETVQAVYYYAGLSHLQTDEPKKAQIAWNRGMKIRPDSELGRKMKKELRRFN